MKSSADPNPLQKARVCISRRLSTAQSSGISPVALRFLSEGNLTPARTKSDGGWDNVAAEETYTGQNTRSTLDRDTVIINKWRFEQNSGRPRFT